MASMIGQMFGNQAQNTSLGGYSALFSRINQLKQMVGGNPAERVPAMLRQWGLTNTQIQQYQAQATQIMNAMKNR